MRDVTAKEMVMAGEDKGSADPIKDMFSAAKYGAINESNVGALYDKMTPDDYEQFLVAINFTEPFYLRDVIVKDKEDGGIGLSSSRDVEILDLGCGTGIVGSLLQPHGFSNIFGIDASAKFVDEIKKRGVYKGAECRYLGQGVDNFPDVYKDKYDIVTGTGIFLAKHVPASSFDDAYAALKVGGYFVLTLRSNLWVDGEACGYKDKMNGYISKGQFELVISKTFMRGREEGIGLFEKQESILIVVKKLDSAQFKTELN